MSNYHMQIPDEVCRVLQTDPNNGLTELRAYEIQKEKGLNRFDEGKKESSRDG